MHLCNCHLCLSSFVVFYKSWKSMKSRFHSYLMPETSTHGDGVEELIVKITHDGQRLKAEGYGDLVINRLQALRNNSELCDFKVSADGRTFEVHKAILAATSDYFRVMFGGVMAESKQNAVDLKGVTADGLQNVVDFIYSGDMGLTLDNLTEVINTAGHLQIPLALEVCSGYIKSLMTFDNADQFLHIADVYSLDKVIAHWNYMVQDKFFEFSQSAAFLKMGGESLCHLLAENTLRVSSEFQLLMCISRWIQAAPARLMSFSDHCMQNVRFALMSERELSLAMEHECVKQCPGRVGVQLVRRAFMYHKDCERGHPAVDGQSRVRSPSPSLVMIHHGTPSMPFQVTAYNRAADLFYVLFSDVNGSRDCRVAAVDNFAYTCRIVDFGGGSLMPTLFRFDPCHLVGQELQPMQHVRLEFCLVAAGMFLYVFGGSAEDFTIVDTVEAYNVKANTWECIQPLPQPTHSLAGVSYEGCVYLSGGVCSPDRHTTGTVFCFDHSLRTYTSLSTMMYARRLHEMAYLGHKLYILGGIPKADLPTYGQIPIEVLCLSTLQWTKLSATLSGRSIGHYINHEGQILVLGHEHRTSTEDEIWTFDPVLDDWFHYAKAPQRLSLNHAMSTLLWVNFNDEKICSRFMKEK